MQTLVEQPKNNEATIDAIKLYIPDECKADLLSFIKQLCLHRKKREVTKQYFKRTLNDYGLASMPEISIADAWARCIVDVESESPKTIFDFWARLETKAQETFNLRINNLNALEIKNKLAIAVFTALTNALFLQFVNEPDLQICTQKLKAITEDHTVINWTEVNTVNFTDRLRGAKWSLLYPLLVDMDANGTKQLNTSLLSCMGLNEHDFIHSIMIDKNPNAQKIEKNNELFQSIDSCVITYALLGDLLFLDDNYFVMTQGTKFDPYQCLVISTTFPYKSVTYFANETSWAQIKAGTFFDDESINRLFKAKKNIEKNHLDLKLTISERFKPQLFALLEEHYLDSCGNNGNMRKRDILKEIIRRSSIDFIGYTPSLDLNSEWERCIKVVEAKQPDAVLEFAHKLTGEINQKFQVQFNYGWWAPEKYRNFSFTLYAILLQSLFDQFAHEKDLYKCATRLNKAVTNTSLIQWEKIDMQGFVERLKEDWFACLPLMRDPINKYTTPDLLNHIDMGLSHFTNAFFSKPKAIEYTNNSNHSDFFPYEIFSQIASHVNPSTLNNFRLTCKAFYNAVEQVDTTRINHRLDLLSKQGTALNELIGTVIYRDNNFLLTYPKYNHSYQCYRATYLTSPYKSESYTYSLDSHREITAGYIFLDANNMLNVLTIVNINSIKYLKIDPQNMKENIIYGSAIVNYPRDTYYHYKSDISVINNEVLIDTRVSTNKGSFFYHSQFMLSDLDNSNMHNSIDVEPTSCSEITARWY